MIDPKAGDVEDELNELSLSLENFDEAMELAFQLYQNVYSLYQRRAGDSLSSWLIDQKTIQSDAYHAADLFVKEKGIRKAKLESLVRQKCKELDALVEAGKEEK